MAMADPLPFALLRNQEQWDVPGSGQPLAQKRPGHPSVQAAPRTCTCSQRSPQEKV